MEEDSLLGQLTALADMVSEEYEGVGKFQLSINPKTYIRLTEEVGHAVHVIGGVRLIVEED